MSRELHAFEHVTCTEKTVPEVLTDASHGAVFVVAPDDSRLDTFLHRHGSGQTTLFGDDSLLPSSYDYQIGGLPESSDDSLPIETDAYDTLITLFSLSGYFQRGPAFMDFTRIVSSDGTILSATGLQPTEDAYHDFKGWVPNSKRVTLEEIILTRTEAFQTPNLVAKFTRDRPHKTPSPSRSRKSPRNARS